MSFLKLRIRFLKNNMNIQVLKVQIQSYYTLIDLSVHNEEKKNSHSFSLLWKWKPEQVHWQYETIWVCYF